MSRALKNNLKKRKVFQKKIKNNEWAFYQIDGLKKWL
jgi:hypothetical protein